MTMTIEKKLRDFTFWGGATSNAAKLTPEELDKLEEKYEIDSFDFDIPSITEINDDMWFSFETICEWLELDYEKVMARE